MGTVAQQVIDVFSATNLQLNTVKCSIFTLFDFYQNKKKALEEKINTHEIKANQNQGKMQKVLLSLP